MIERIPSLRHSSSRKPMSAQQHIAPTVPRPPSHLAGLRPFPLRWLEHPPDAVGGLGFPAAWTPCEPLRSTIVRAGCRGSSIANLVESTTCFQSCAHAVQIRSPRWSAVSDRLSTKRGSSSRTSRSSRSKMSRPMRKSSNPTRRAPAPNGPFSAASWGFVLALSRRRPTRRPTSPRNPSRLP